MEPTSEEQSRQRILADIKKYEEAFWWYHTIDLGGGLVTPGLFDHTPYLKYYGLPDDLTGQRVLDVGTSNGYFAFEMERRGAKEVVAVDIVPDEVFNFCKWARGSKARFVNSSIHDLTPQMLGGTFDLVFCGDLFLHLDDIVGAARVLRSLTRGTVIIASAYFEGVPEDQPLTHAYLRAETVACLDGPAKGARHNFNVTWIGNRAFYFRLLEYVGFTDIEIVSTHLLKPATAHRSDMPEGIAHIVVRAKGPDGSRSVSLGNAAKKLEQIQKSVLGDAPPVAREIELFQREDRVSGNRSALHQPLQPPIRVTFQYPIRSHRRVIGGAIILAKKVVRRFMKRFIDPLLDQINPVLNAFQSYFESHERRIHELQQQLEQSNLALMELFEHLSSKVREGEQGYAELQRRHDENLKRLSALFESLATAAGKMEEEKRHIAGLQQRHDENLKCLSELFEHLSAKVENLPAAFSADIRQMQEKVVAIDESKLPERLGRAERLLKQLEASAGKATIPGQPLTKGPGAGWPEPASGGLDYFYFHEKFRGSEQLITERQQRYVNLFLGREKTLDIGCGRGEFLEQLKKHQIRSYGIDLDGDMIRSCTEKGIEAYQEDAISHLSLLAAGSLGGIFSSQFIEHLSTPELVKLIELCYDRLEPGGIYVTETLNPGSLHYLTYFYRDPTHIRPFPSETVKFMLERTGFVSIRTEYIGHSDTNARIEEIPVETGSSMYQQRLFDHLNRSFAIINARLFGPIEYVIMAEKPRSQG